MKAHVVYLHLKDGHVTCDPNLATEHLNIGDTISFVSSDGKPTVVFEEPLTLSAGKYEDGDPPLTILKPGNFVFHCGIRLTDGQVIGWPSDPSAGGAGTPTVS